MKTVEHNWNVRSDKVQNLDKSYWNWVSEGQWAEECKRMFGKKTWDQWKGRFLINCGITWNILNQNWGKRESIKKQYFTGYPTQLCLKGSQMSAALELASFCAQSSCYKCTLKLVSWLFRTVLLEVLALVNRNWQLTLQLFVLIVTLFVMNNFLYVLCCANLLNYIWTRNAVLEQRSSIITQVGFEVERT